MNERKELRIQLTLSDARHLYDLIRSAPWMTWTNERNRAYNNFLKKLDKAEKRNERTVSTS